MKVPADSDFGAHNDRLLFTLYPGDELVGVRLGDGRRGELGNDRSRLILFFEVGRGLSVKEEVDCTASVTRLPVPECNSVGSRGT